MSTPARARDRSAARPPSWSVAGLAAAVRLATARRLVRQLAGFTAAQSAVGGQLVHTGEVLGARSDTAA